MNFKVKFVGQMEIGEKGFVNPCVFEKGKADILTYVGNKPTPGFLEIQRVAFDEFKVLRTC
ncbi:MAG: hypothetical protein A3H51_02540 [Candidatus Spechtbacteria bacterium RIFCSPLOWO2_02_FULL_38_8]|uniref:Uncharacterized protein n=1 Tax=Candidatus Spechtbacteria bacterium RIFCSPLOWO2_02_FULL_38_8 TaxID=1802164 RepID=A0A1G2HJU0_9BACT|nr:MAG: hypothetical protein A3H51_02540 [Candidatus Spechtbacteria bacterium RIFCSPLOWO2_02_FULL_38_8]